MINCERGQKRAREDKYLARKGKFGFKVENFKVRYGQPANRQKIPIPYEHINLFNSGTF